jgi:hypothetical protein
MKISMDKQYKYRNGEPARVLCVDRPGIEKYPVLSMTKTGKLYRHTVNGSVCAEKEDYDLIEVSPYDDFVIDEPVMVRDKTAETWARGYFAGVDKDGIPMTWAEGATSWSIVNSATGWTIDGVEEFRYRWHECRRPTPDELGQAQAQPAPKPRPTFSADFWQNMPAWVVCVAMDYDGRWYGYDAEAKADYQKCGWWVDRPKSLMRVYGAHSNGAAWDETLTMRPQ